MIFLDTDNTQNNENLNRQNIIKTQTLDTSLSKLVEEQRMAGGQNDNGEIK